MNLNPRLGIMAAAALAVPALTSCGSNFEAATDQVYIPAEGVNSRDGMVDVLNALVVSGEDGTGTVIATLVNGNPETTDRLVGVAGAQEDSAAEVTGVDEVETEIAPLTHLNLAEEGGIVVTYDDVVPGNFIWLTFSFESGEPAELLVPVVAHEGIYADVPLGPVLKDDEEAEEEADEE